MKAVLFFFFVCLFWFLWLWWMESSSLPHPPPACETKWDAIKGKYTDPNYPRSSSLNSVLLLSACSLKSFYSSLAWITTVQPRVCGTNSLTDKVKIQVTDSKNVYVLEMAFTFAWSEAESNKNNSNTRDKQQVFSLFLHRTTVRAIETGWLTTYCL